MKRWPLWARLTATIILVSICAAIPSVLPRVTSYPILLMFAGIFVSAALFGREAGYLSVLLADLFLVFLLLPHYGLKLHSSREVLGLIVFNAISLTTVAIIAALQTKIDELARRTSDLDLAKERLAASERDKELLLREAGHRIKNNLMMLIGVIRAHRRMIQDERARDVLHSIADRIQVFARVHDRLQAADSAPVVNMSEFLQALCDDLVSATADVRPVSLKLKTQDEFLSQHKAVAAGLIVNELVTNAFKHAFPDDRSGAIEVEFTKHGSEYVIVVSDDGVGFQDSPLPSEESRALGQLLIRSMAAQLGGTFEIGPGPGGRAQIRFPIAN